MSIQSEITLLQNTKDELRTAIMEKGVTVEANDLFSTYPTRISQISMTPGDKDALLIGLVENSLTTFDIPVGTKELGNYALSGQRLTSVTIPNTVTVIGERNFNAAQCAITIPSSVEYIGDYAFSSPAIQSLTFEATVPPRLGLNYVFGIQTTWPIYVPEESVQAYKTAWPQQASRIQAIPVNTFAIRFTPSNGDPVIEVELEDLTTEGVLTRGDIPSSILNGTGSLEIGDGVTQIAGAQISNDGVFYGCRGITSVRISNTVTTIGNWAFSTCGIENVVIPNSVKDIGDYVFQNCGIGLVNATLPDGITRIGKNLFRDCSKLEYIDIPSSVTSIGGRAFYGCTSLLYITVNATTPPTLDNANAFSDTNNCPIYVPAESVETYESASGWWNTYASRIEAIPS